MVVKRKTIRSVEIYCNVCGHHADHIDIDGAYWEVYATCPKCKEEYLMGFNTDE